MNETHTAESRGPPGWNLHTKGLAVHHVGPDAVTQHCPVPIHHANVIDTVSEVGGRVYDIVARRKGTFGIGEDLTVLLKHFLLAFVTLGTEVPTASIFAHHSTHGHLPGSPEALHVFGHFTIWQCEFICVIVVEVPAQTASVVHVVAGYGDGDVIDHVIGHPQAEVS